jgi:DNA-directed RNA polymerase specialized sigma24 family protein
MNGTDSKAFDRWMEVHHEELRSRLMIAGVFDEDAFQEAYIRCSESRLQKASEDELMEAFMAFYRAEVTREYRIESMFIHPDPLYFQYLRTEPLGQEEGSLEVDSERAARQLCRFCKDRLKKDEHTIFDLYFVKALTLKECVMYTGKSFGTVQRMVVRIREFIQRRFIAQEAVHN